jgi:hypothetical protein
VERDFKSPTPPEGMKNYHKSPSPSPVKGEGNSFQFEYVYPLPLREGRVRGNISFFSHLQGAREDFCGW